MTTQNGSPKTAPRGQTLAAVAAAALAFGLIGGVGAWRLGPHGHGSSGATTRGSAVAAAGQTRPTVQQTMAPAVLVPPGTSALTVPYGNQGMTVFLAGSEVQAEIIRRQAAAYDTAEPIFRIVVAHSDAEAIKVQQELVSENEFRLAFQLPFTTLTDLRPATSSPTASSAECFLQSPFAQELVCSDSSTRAR